MELYIWCISSVGTLTHVIWLWLLLSLVSAISDSGCQYQSVNGTSWHRHQLSKRHQLSVLPAVSDTSCHYYQLSATSVLRGTSISSWKWNQLSTVPAASSTSCQKHQLPLVRVAAPAIHNYVGLPPLVKSAIALKAPHGKRLS